MQSGGLGGGGERNFNCGKVTCATNGKDLVGMVSIVAEFPPHLSAAQPHLLLR